MSPETQLGALSGTALGGAYQVTRLIGEGGMGWVYEARQLRLNKRVAVKVMSRELAANSEALARFRREAEVTSQLGHPHLVSVIDFGAMDTGEPYLVMEYLDGEDLDHRIRRVGRLPLDIVVEITKQVASALAAAHEEGIVHRDLKPGNVFLVKVRGEADFVKVLDFGISKIKASRTKLTRATAVIGTPEYMSPEQATGLIEEIDDRTDQWALGCIAWEMLSGYAPFIADDMAALFYQVINMDPHPLSRRAPGLPPAVEPALRRALAKRAADRYPSIKDFSRALQAAATGLPREVTPPPIMTPRMAATKGTLAYSNALPSAKSVVAAPNAATSARRGAAFHAESLANDSDVADDFAEELRSRGRNRAYAILGTALVLLLVGVLVFWPRKPQTSASLPTTLPALPKSPEVLALPPLPTAPPTSALPPESDPARPARTTPSKGTALEGLMKEAATAKSPGAGERKPADSPRGREKPSAYANPFEPERSTTRPAESFRETGKPSPFADPFEADRVSRRPAERKPTKARPSRQIIEEL